MNNLSAVVLAKNEEENITRCIKSLRFADEVIVIDDNSTDKTIEVAEELKAKVFKRDLGNDFSQQRNFGLKKASFKWILFVDADEVVTDKLAKDIITVVEDKNNNNMGYLIRRRDVLFGKKLRFGEGGNTLLLRLARKNAGEWFRKVHENWVISGKVGKLNGKLLHYPHPTLTKFISDLNFYSSLHAMANYDEGKTSNLFKIVFFPIFKFLQNYIINLGIMDGIQGFIVAMMMSLHSYLSWSKLWMMQKLLSKQ